MPKPETPPAPPTEDQPSAIEVRIGRVEKTLTEIRAELDGLKNPAAREELVQKITKLETELAALREKAEKPKPPEPPAPPAPPKPHWRQKLFGDGRD